MNDYDRILLQLDSEDYNNNLIQKRTPLPQEKPGFVSTLGDRFMQGTYDVAGSLSGAVSGVGDLVGSKGLSNLGNEASEDWRLRTEDIERRNPSMSFSEAQTPTDYLNWGAQTIARQAPQLIETAAEAYLGGAAGRGIAGALKLGQGAATAAETASIMNRASKIGGMTGGGVGSIANEFGSIYNDQPTGEKDALKALKYAVPAGALDFLPMADIARRTGVGRMIVGATEEAALPLFGRYTMKSALKKGAQNVGMGILEEAPTEAAQSIFETAGAGKPVLTESARQKGALTSILSGENPFTPELTRDMKESGAAGGFIGGFMGGAGHVGGSMLRHVDAKVLSAPLVNITPEGMFHRLALAERAGESLTDPVERATWTKNAQAAIAMNMPIDVHSETFLKELGQPEKEAAAASIGQGEVTDLLSPMPGASQTRNPVINPFGTVEQPVDFRRPDYTRGMSTSNPDGYLDLLGTKGTTAPAFTLQQAPDISFQGQRARDESGALDAWLMDRATLNRDIASPEEQAIAREIAGQRGALSLQQSPVAQQVAPETISREVIPNAQVQEEVQRQQGEGQIAPVQAAELQRQGESAILPINGGSNVETQSPSRASGEVQNTPGMVEGAAAAKNEGQYGDNAVKAVSSQGREVTSADIPFLSAAHQNIRDKHDNHFIDGNRASRSWSTKSQLAPYLDETGLNRLQAAKVLSDATKGIFPKSSATAQWRLIESAIDHERSIVESFNQEVIDELSGVDTSFNFGANVESQPESKPLYDRTAEGDQGKLFATPPTFGKKAQGKGAVEENPMLTEMKEREAEKKQGNLALEESAKSDTAKSVTTPFSISSEVTGTSTESLKPLTSFFAKNGIDLDGKVEAVEVKGEKSDNIRKIAKVFNQDVVFVKWNDGQLFNGVVLPGDRNKIYISVDSSKSHMVVTGHELLHQLSNKYPLLYKQLQRNLSTQFKDFEKFVENINKLREERGIKPLSIEGASEELIADFLGEQMTNPAFWNKLGQVNPSLFQKVAKILIDIFNKIMGVSQTTDAYIKDIQKAQDILVKAISDFSEATGKGKELVEEAKMMMTPLTNVQEQIVDKGVSINSSSREVLRATKPKALEAINTTVKDYNNPGRYLFRAYNAKDEKGNTVPYNPDRTHEASGELLKGSWWTTSLATAQEIAWSKGEDAKVVALPVEKIPESVYVQNTNPPGYVYDLFVGLPEDVPLSDVQEVAVTSEPKFSLTADTVERIKNIDAGTLAVSIKRILNPLDWSKFKDTFERITPQGLQNAIGYLGGNPVYQAARDPMKKDFVDTAIKREEIKAQTALDLKGWDGPKGETPGVIERLKNVYTHLEDVDKTTAWGRITQDYHALSKADRQAVDTIVEQGDVKTTVYKSLAGAMKNKKIAEANPSEAAFKVYQGIREHIDGTVADAIEKYIRKMGKEEGLPEIAINKHIKDFREKLAKRPGWMPRNHGEGDYQVNVYHIIEDLKFTQQPTENGQGHQAFMDYFAGNAATKLLRKLAAARGLHFKLLANGETAVTSRADTATKIAQVIAKLQKRMDKPSLYESDREALQERIDALQAKLEMVSQPAEQQIASFIESTKTVLPEVRKQYEQDLQAFRDEMAATEIPAEKRRIQKEIDALGDGRVRVKRYMRLQTTESNAARHVKEVQANIQKFMPEGYREGEKYEVSSKFKEGLSESMYGDMKADFAVEAAQEAAVKRMADKGEISKQEAAALRNNIVRATAEVLMARGAGQRQIRRANYLIEGYNKNDVAQEYDDYMNGSAGMISKALYARDQFDNYRYAEAKVKAWAERYIKDSLRNMNRWDRVGGNARSLATFMFLGFKVSSLMVNATQIYTLGVAHLGMFTKRSAILAIGGAQKDIITGKLTAEEKEIFASHIWKLQEMETAVHEMTGKNEGVTGKMSKYLHIITQKALAPFQEVELLNRRSMILAAYRVLTADGMGKDEAIAKALDINRQVNFEMSRANLPGFTRNPVGRTVYALQSFMWNNFNWIYNRATGGTKQDMLALLRYAGMMFVIGGAMAIPGGDELDKLYRKLSGKSLKLEWQEWSRKHAKKYGDIGLMLNDFVWHGAPSITGVNISNAIRLQIPVVSNILSGDSVMESATGVFGGMMQKGATAMKAAGKGDTYRAIESAAPEFISAPMKAYRQATRGVTTLSGKPVFDENGKPLKYSALDTVKRSAGFQPIRQSERMDIAETGKALKKQWNDDRQELIDSLRIAEKPADKQRIMREIIKWNSDLQKSQARGIVLPIKPDTLKRSLSAKPDKNMTAFQRNYLME